MTNTFPTLLTAAAAAAFLTFTPVHAQEAESTGIGAPPDIFAERAEPHRQWMGETLRGMPADTTISPVPEPRDAAESSVREPTDATVGSSLPADTTISPVPEPPDATIDATVGSPVPDTAVRHPVPDAIVEVVPEARGYEYLHLTDGRIVLVHPGDNTIAMVLD